MLNISLRFQHMGSETIESNRNECILSLLEERTASEGPWRQKTVFCGHPEQNCSVFVTWSHCGGSRGILRLGRGVACELIQNQSSLPSGQCHPISCHLRAACSVSYKGAQFIFQTEISKYLKFAAYSNTCSSDKSGLSLELGLDMYLTELQ